MSKTDSDSFSARQEQVILLASKGLADKQIAIELGLSIATIHTYWSRLRKKFGGGNRAELVTLALHRNAEETLTARESENLQLIAEIVRRAQAEKELAESQSKLQAIIDNTPVAVFVKDRYGRYTLVNSVFQELVGRDREIIIGSRDHDLFGGELGAKYQEQDQAVLESREPVEGEITFHGPNGDRQFLCIKFPLIDTEDNVYAVGGFANDITSRTEVDRQLRNVHADLKAVNEALERRVRTRTIELEETNVRLQQEIAERKRSEEDLLNMFHFAQGVIESSPEGIVCFDRDCNITAWNKTMEEMSGLPRLEVLGHNAFNIFPFLVEVGEDEQFRRTLEGETLESQGKPYRVIGNGSVDLYNASYRPVRNDANEVIGGIVIVREHETSNRVTCL